MLDEPDVDEYNPDLFRNPKGNTPIPFVIDPNISSPEEREQLTEWIEESGGQVVETLPTKAPSFFVYDATNPKGKLNAVETCVRPLQHPVHISWLLASIEENGLLPWREPLPDQGNPQQLSRVGMPRGKRILEDFVPEYKGLQLPVYIDYSIQGEERRNLANLIIRHGGFLTLCEDQARIIIANQDDEEWYKHVWGPKGVVTRIRGRDCWVESPRALKNWIRDGTVALTPVPKPKTTPGRKPDASRTEFTMSDDVLLVKFLAKQTPFGNGRQGNIIYQQFETYLKDQTGKIMQKPEGQRTKEDKQILYAVKHPWSSWQNRYKKAKEDFDGRIDRYLEDNPHLLQRGGETRRRPRRASAAGKKRAKVVREVDDEEEDELDSEDEDQEPERSDQEDAPAQAEGAGEAEPAERNGREPPQGTSSKEPRSDGHLEDAEEERQVDEREHIPPSTLPPPYATQAPTTTETPPASPVKRPRPRRGAKKTAPASLSDLMGLYGEFFTEPYVRKILASKGGDIGQTAEALRQAKQALDGLVALPQSPLAAEPVGEPATTEEGTQQRRRRAPKSKESAPPQAEQERAGSEAAEEGGEPEVQPRATRSRTAAKRAAEEAPVSRRTRQKSSTSGRS